jgi:hypothetical protein
MGKPGRIAGGFERQQNDAVYRPALLPGTPVRASGEWVGSRRQAEHKIYNESL